MKRNKQLLVLTHLSQLLDFVTGIGGLIIPLVMWLTKRDEIIDMDHHGKSIINFRITMFIYLLICIPLILLLGLGLLGILAIAIPYMIFSIVNAIKASNNKDRSNFFIVIFYLIHY